MRAAVSTEYIESEPPIYRSYYPDDRGLRPVLLEVFADFGWSRPFANLERDVDFLLQALLEHFDGELPAPEPDHQLQVLGSAFYRNKAAYVIGKIVNGDAETAFGVPVLHDEDGNLVLDTVLFDDEGISVLFSLSRAYFMVDMDVPSGYIHFLQTLMPSKPRSELYTAVGLAKQGKTLFYRDLLHHLHHSQDVFVEAPGTPGLVMHVFNLPSYPYVLKVIKDEFGHSKQTDRATVKRKFLMVKQIDRVGRMADTLEFKNLALPRDRFAPELLEQLLELAPSTIEPDGANVIVGHCYVERRMTPLNLYLETATPEEVEDVVREYGDTIRDLAIANVFAGDMLWRNFGVNRHGRVVFYDYDEIEYLTDCTFRVIPPPPNPEAELSGEPWYPVGPLDVFPEEFETFLLGNQQVREAFMRHHADLLLPEFWQRCQEQVGRERSSTSSPTPTTCASAGASPRGRNDRRTVFSPLRNQNVTLVRSGCVDGCQPRAHPQHLDLRGARGLRNRRCSRPRGRARGRHGRRARGRRRLRPRVLRGGGGKRRCAPRRRADLAGSSREMCSARSLSSHRAAAPRPSWPSPRCG